MLLWNAGGSQLSDPDRHKQATVKVLDYIYWLHQRYQNWAVKSGISRLLIAKFQLECTNFVL